MLTYDDVKIEAFLQKVSLNRTWGRYTGLKPQNTIDREILWNCHQVSLNRWKGRKQLKYFKSLLKSSNQWKPEYYIQSYLHWHLCSMQSNEL